MSHALLLASIRIILFVVFVFANPKQFLKKKCVIVVDSKIDLRYVETIACVCYNEDTYSPSKILQQSLRLERLQISLQAYFLQNLVYALFFTKKKKQKKKFIKQPK